MRTKNVIILAVVVLALLLIVTFASNTLLKPANNTTNNTTLNISDNNTDNNTQNQSTETTKKTTQQISEKSSSNDEVTYDPELNDYFDSNGRTVKEGQFPKGTSKSEMRQALQEVGDS